MKLNQIAWRIGMAAVVLTGGVTPSGTPDHTGTGR